MKNIFEGVWGEKIKLLGITLISAVVIAVANLILSIITRFVEIPKYGELVIGWISIVVIFSIIVTLSIVVNQSFKLNKQFPNNKLNIIGIIASIILGLFVFFVLLLLYNVLMGYVIGSSSSIKTGKRIRNSSKLWVLFDLSIYGSAISFYSISLWWIVNKVQNHNNILPQSQ